MQQTFDFVCIGSGAAGMSAAIRAQALGGSVLILEASDRFGGSTAISGGVVWVPNNPQMGPRGVPDSRADALAYMSAITEGQVSPERLETYVDASARMLAWFEENSALRLDALEEYSDYYAEAPGGKPGGRSMEPVPFDATQLGSAFRELRDPHRQSQVMGRFGITAREAKGYLAPSLAGRLKLMWRFIQYGLRWFKRRRFHRDTKLYAGNALIARLRGTLLDRDIPLWLSSPARELLVEDGRVVGVVAEREGAKLEIRARQGVLLAAGGFERSKAMREAHHRLPSSPEWNAGNHHNQGAGINMGVAVGGATDLMHEAWWTPVTLVPKSDRAWVLVVEKSLPGGIMVNRHAQRFTNEAAPYQDVVHAMYDNDAVPECFLVFDAEYRRRYPVGPIAPGYAQPDQRLSRKYRDGFLIKAPTLAALAEACGLDPAALQQTVARFNPMADRGLDEDFGRGNCGVDRYYADDTVKPNPSLRGLTVAPFYAIRVYPGDLGTKGGLVTDVDARVLDAQGQPIPGLYAAGNTTASVMGPTYPGAGGTIGPALTFGMLAAEAAAADALSPAKVAVGGG